MIREDLARDPTLKARLRDDVASPVLAPHAGDALTGDQAAGLDLILEGFLAHHLTPRHLRSLGGPQVLAGDFCYATGLERVADAGDVEVIRLLADLVARSAGMVATGRGADLPVLWRVVHAAIAAPDRTDAVAALDAALAADDAGDPAPLRALADAAAPIPALQEALT